MHSEINTWRTDCETSWDSIGNNLQRRVRVHYEDLQTAGENLTKDEKNLVINLLVEHLHASVVSFMRSMPENVKKGIMKHPFFAEHKQPFLGRFISDNFDSDGFLKSGSFYH